MSLDVTLRGARGTSPGSGIFVREDGSLREISREEWDARNPGREPVIWLGGDPPDVWTRNITHNLGEMAEAAGIYMHLWRPEEIGISHAHQLITPLADGISRLILERDNFRACNPENGWGSYEGLLEFVSEYLVACIQNPHATVEVDR